MSEIFAARAKAIAAPELGGGVREYSRGTKRGQSARSARWLVAWGSGGALGHGFPIAGGAKALGEVDEAGVEANEDAGFAFFDAFEDAGGGGGGRSGRDLFEEGDGFLFAFAGGVGAEAGVLGDG